MSTMSSSSPIPPPPSTHPESPEMSPTRLRKDISEFTHEKQLTLVIADLFEGIAQEQRAVASKMKSLRACRNFRVDVRGSNYFLCQCGHAKSAHAFSPLPEDDLFVGSTGITPKFEVVEEDDTSQVRSSVLSFGSDVAGETTSSPVLIPCLDEFRKNFKEKQALQQPRITLIEKSSREALDDTLTDRDSEQGSERNHLNHHPHHHYSGLSDSLKAVSLVGINQAVKNHRTISQDNTSVSSIGEEAQSSNHNVAKFLQEQRLKESMRAEIQRELNGIMFQRAKQYEEDMEKRFQEAMELKFEQVEREKEKMLEEVDSNCRKELENMQNQFMDQLDEIEVNAQAYIEELKKSHEVSDRNKDKRHKDLLAGLMRQADVQLEELNMLRRLRDRQLSSGALSEGSNGGGGLYKAASSSSHPLRRSSRELVTALSKLSEADEEEDEDGEEDNGSTLKTREDMQRTNSPIRETRVQTVSSGVEPKQYVLLFIAVLFVLLAVAMFQMGISSMSDFRVRLLRPFVLKVAKLLSGQPQA